MSTLMQLLQEQRSWRKISFTTTTFCGNMEADALYVRPLFVHIMRESGL